MRVAYFSVEGSTLAWARRLMDEGAEVMVIIQKLHAQRVGRGIVPRALSIEAWVKWGNASPHTIWFFDCTNSGKLADRLRKAGKHVIGGSEFQDKLENDRPFGERFAMRNGILMPPTKPFSSVKASIAYMRESKQTVGDGGWAWKPNDAELGTAATYVGECDRVVSFCERSILPEHGDNVSCVVQERIPGVALSTARWWNGDTWVGPYEGTLEEKKFMNDDIGPATGCSINTVWFYLEETPKIAKALRWDHLAAHFIKEIAPPGLYDINAIINEEGAYFLEWTPRLGVDSELTSQRGITSLSELFLRLIDKTDIDDLFDVTRGYHGVRLSVPPYPCEAKELGKLGVALGTPIEDIDSLWKGNFVMAGVEKTKLGFEVADPFGFVGTCVVSDTSVPKAYDRINKACKKFSIPNLQRRTDGAKIVCDDIAAMKKHGWGTTSYLSTQEEKDNAA